MRLVLRLKIVFHIGRDIILRQKYISCAVRAVCYGIITIIMIIISEARAKVHRFGQAGHGG